MVHLPSNVDPSPNGRNHVETLFLMKPHNLLGLSSQYHCSSFMKLALRFELKYWSYMASSTKISVG